MSTTKKVIKTNKTEPAGTKKGTKPAAPKTDGKKNVTPAKETATPPPAPEVAVIPVTEHERAIEKKNNLLEKAKDRIVSLELLLQNAEEKANNTVADTRGWVNRGNKWVFAAVPVLIALCVWFFYVNPQFNKKDVQIEKVTKENEQWKRDYQDLLDETRYDSTHKTNDGVKRPDVSIIEKKSPVTNR